MWYFYPRSPCGERPNVELHDWPPVRISIHALLAESDMIHPRLCNVKLNFYPRSPCGERLMYTLKLANLVLFLSTLSLRRATCIIDIINNIIDNFYPRSPCGERQANNRTEQQARRISIHALLAESDYSLIAITPSNFSFLSTLSLRRATVTFLLYNSLCQISIHALLAESDRELV